MCGHSLKRAFRLCRRFSVPDSLGVRSQNFTAPDGLETCDMSYNMLAELGDWKVHRYLRELNLRQVLRWSQVHCNELRVRVPPPQPVIPPSACSLKEGTISAASAMGSWATRSCACWTFPKTSSWIYETWTTWSCAHSAWHRTSSTTWKARPPPFLRGPLLQALAGLLLALLFYLSHLSLFLSLSLRM